jgi:exonuclease III
MNGSNGHSNKPYISARHQKLMAQLLKISAWNINALRQHPREIKLFIQTLNLDILLVPKPHFTNRSYRTIPNYNIYYTNHSDERVHGGTAVIIRQNIKHYVKTEYRHENIQSTSIAIEDNTGETTVSAIYCLPNATTNMTITIDLSKHSETV